MQYFLNNLGKRTKLTTTKSILLVIGAINKKFHPNSQVKNQLRRDLHRSWIETLWSLNFGLCLKFLALTMLPLISPTLGLLFFLCFNFFFFKIPNYVELIMLLFFVWILQFRDQSQKELITILKNVSSIYSFTL